MFAEKQIRFDVRILYQTLFDSQASIWEKKGFIVSMNLIINTKKLKGMEWQVTIQRQLYVFTRKKVICYISRTMSNIANVFDYTFWQALVIFS